MGPVEIALVAAIVALALVLFFWTLLSSVVIIQQYESGVYMRLGRYIRTLGPGLHLVAPFVSRIYRADTRVQVLDIGRMELMTRDMSPVVVEAFIQYRMVRPDNSLLKVEKYRSTLSQISHVTMRKLVLEHELEDVLRNIPSVGKQLKERLSSEGDSLGVEILRAEIKELEPVGPIKAAIEDRIAAEKERQAMILRADGRKRAMMMDGEIKKA
ncbi:MAG: SPFH/Band 7/PHB domain protein [Candidatus Thermoplasmatota archaeon]|jgi:regulator of protease activity HflC (stomatin/prohibitin superfamily)|nr:SPFH/Band 7/PHB domain protein [Candidatus Thermoplasmatota archaeon]